MQRKLIWNEKVKQKIPSLLAHLFAIWTLRDSKAYFEMGDGDRAFLKQSHATQIVSIFCMLNMAGEDPQLRSHLAQVLSDEGKSTDEGLASKRLEEYKAKKIHISTLFVGTSDEVGPAFKNISDKTGGQYGGELDIATPSTAAKSISDALGKAVFSDIAAGNDELREQMLAKYQTLFKNS